MNKKCFFPQLDPSGCLKMKGSRLGNSPKNVTFIPVVAKFPPGKLTYTVDGSEIPRPTTWKCIIKPCK